MSTTVEGADTLARTLSTAADTLADMSATNAAVAAMLAGRVNPPRRTGRLAASIHPSSDATTATVGTSLVYAPVHEYGWPRRHIRARRYLSAAFTRSVTDAQRAYERAAAAAVAKVKGA